MDPQREQAIDSRFVKKEEQKSSSEKNSSISDIEEMQANETQGQPWTDQENTIFAIFILHYHDIFKSKRKRKSIRIFKILSQFLKSRKPRQCRSHFQKQMIKHNKNIDRIVEYFKTRDKDFLSIYQNLKASLPEVKSQEKIKMMDKGIQVNLDMQQMQWMKNQSMEIYAPPQYFYPYMDGVYAVTWPGVTEATQCYYKF